MDTRSYINVINIPILVIYFSTMTEGGCQVDLATHRNVRLLMFLWVEIRMDGHRISMS